MDAVKVLDKYIEAEKMALKNVDNITGSDNAGSVKWKARKHFESRIKLLEMIKEDLM